MTKFNFPSISKRNKLNGTAIQNMRLLIVFPFLFATDESIINTSIWELLILLRNITLILLSFNVSRDQITYLRTLLHEYVNELRSQFPNINLKPKHHYILHYPYLISHFGPLRHLWTLRLESKHNISKKLLGVVLILKTYYTLCHENISYFKHCAHKINYILQKLFTIML